MKIAKTNSILRFACALLAVLTVVVSLPLFAIEGKAEDETAAISHSVDFSAGTVDTALSANPTINGVTFSSFQGAPKYATKDGKTVLYGSNLDWVCNLNIAYIVVEGESLFQFGSSDVLVCKG